MTDDDRFHELLRRVRARDQGAAAELVRLYEPAVRRFVRFRLTDTRLGAAFDSMDVCQMVLASFFVRAAAGQYDLAGPEDLVRLLTTMARNKLADQVRRERAERRDNRRVTGAAPEPERVAAAGASPSQEAIAGELFAEVSQRLTPEECELMDLRGQGLDWQAVAARLGSNSAALRKKLSRALDRVTRELGLEEGRHE